MKKGRVDNNRFISNYNILIIFIFILIIIFLIFYLIFNSFGEQSLSIENNYQDIVLSPNCVDSDGMDNLTKGYVNYNRAVYWDSCSSSTMLIERYCTTSDTMSWKSITCPNLCIDGRCVPTMNREKCYIKIEVNETINDTTGNVSFKFVNVSAVFGEFAGNVIPFLSGQPSLSLYTRSAYGLLLLGKYGYGFCGIIYYDNYDPNDPGGMGKINCISENYADYFSTLNYVQLDIPNFVKLGYDVPSKNLVCVRKCKIEGEVINPAVDRCCEGLTLALNLTGQYNCLDCGNGYCSPLEDKLTCSEDCK